MRTSWIGIAILGMAAAVSGCGEPANGKTADAKVTTTAIPVEVRAPLRAEMLAVYSGTASLEADQEAAVVAKVSGEVRSLLVEEGRVVRAGELLARLDGDQLRLEADKANATLARLERDYRRNVELHEKGLMASGALENLKFEVAAQRAAYELTRLQLSYTEIRAPIAGVISERLIKVGNTIKPNDVVFRIADLSPLLAYVHVPERELERLKPGQSTHIEVDAVPGRNFIGRVARLSPVIDPATATFKVTIEVQDPSARLKPGMFARVGIVYEQRDRALQIPRNAIVDNEGQATVFVVENGKAQQRPIRVGLANAGFVEVTDGLAGPEQIVVVGQSGLKSGTQVRVVTLAATRATT